MAFSEYEFLLLTININFFLQFKSPVSNAWLLYKGELLSVDMFDNRNIPALSSFEQKEQPQHPPLLYVGKE